MSSMRKAQVQFDYAALETATRRFVLERTERIHNLARMTATGIVQIGQYLAEVKARLPHGEFLKWISSEFGWNRTSVWAFMQVHERFECSNFEHLQIDVSALYLIAAPSTPEPVRAEVIRRAKNGEPITHAGARAMVQRFAETGEIPDIKATLPQIITGRRALPPPEPRSSAEEMREAAIVRREIGTNSARMAAMMEVIHAIEAIAHTEFSMGEVAHHIERFDTPDQDWGGAARRSFAQLKELIKELQL